MPKYDVAITYLNDTTETLYYVDDVNLIKDNNLHINESDRSHMIPMSNVKKVTTILREETGE